MSYAIFDSTGNLIESFDDWDSAYAFLRRVVENEPEAAEDVALFTFDNEGNLIDEPVMLEPAVAYSSLIEVIGETERRGLAAVEVWEEFLGSSYGGHVEAPATTRGAVPA